MSNKPSDHPLFGAINDVASAILLAEKDVDAGILSTAELIVTTLRTQAAHGLAPSVSEPALAKLRIAIDATMAGRSAMIEAHREFGRIAAAYGADESTWGPTWPCTDGKPKGARAARRLAAVA